MNPIFLINLLNQLISISNLLIFQYLILFQTQLVDTSLDVAIFLGFHGSNDDPARHLFLETLGYKLDTDLNLRTVSQSQEGTFHIIKSNISSNEPSAPNTFKFIQQETIYVSSADKYYKGVIYFNSANPKYEFRLFELSIDSLL